MATLSDLAGTKWTGTSELWLDPLGHEAKTSTCTLSVVDAGLTYTWSYEGKDQEGTLTLTDGGAEWKDSWHQAELMQCAAVADSWALVDVEYSYDPGEGPHWGWRITLSQRPPTDELVLQMTNVCPWGEHGRAVRMVYSPADS